MKRFLTVENPFNKVDLLHLRKCSVIINIRKIFTHHKCPVVNLIDRIRQFYRLQTRTAFKYRFFDFVAEQFSKNYSKQIGDWCEQNNILFTGTMPALVTPFEKNGKIGYYDAEGNAVTGTQTIDGYTYEFDADGYVSKMSWIREDGVHWIEYLY